jgi:hypothetical protein
LPSWVKSGSSAQFSNDAKSNSDFGIQIFSDHFKHVFSTIGPTGAEIWPFKGFGKNLFYELPLVLPFVKADDDTIHSVHSSLFFFWL